MDELSKISRSVKKASPEASLEVLLVLDAITGQNAISQAEEFCKAANATGVVLTKLDGTPKGGCVIGVHEKLGLPIRFIGVGEKIDDLILGIDSATDFVESLLPEVPPCRRRKRSRQGRTSMIVCAATNNAGKLKELRRILEPLGHEVKSLRELGMTLTPRKPAPLLRKTPASRPRPSARPAACPPWPMTRASARTRCTVRPACTAPATPGITATTTPTTKSCCGNSRTCRRNSAAQNSCRRSASCCRTGRALDCRGRVPGQGGLCAPGGRLRFWL